MMWFLRFSLFLTVYVLASSEVQAQVVGEKEDSYVVIWRVDKTDENGYSWEYGRCYFTPDRQFVYHQKYPAAEGNIDPEAKFNLLIKRDVLTGEIVEERELFFKISAMSITDDQKYLITDPVDSDKGIIVYDFQTFDTISVIKPDLYEIFKNKYTNEEIENLGYTSGGSIFRTHHNQTILIRYYLPEVGDKYPGNFPPYPNQLLCIFDIKTGEFLYEIYGTKHSGTYRWLNTIKFSTDGKYIMAWEVFYSNDGKNNNDIRVWSVDNQYSDYRAGANYNNNIDGFYYLRKSESVMIAYERKSKNEPRYVIYNMKDKKIEREIKDIKSLLAGRIAAVNYNENYMIHRQVVDFGENNYLVNLNTFDSYVIPDGLSVEETRGIGYSAFWKENENVLVYYTGYGIYLYAISFDPEKVITDVKPDDEIINFLYPNPATETINIPINEYTERIEVYDVLGNVVWKSSSVASQTLHRSVSTSVRIDVSHLPTGVYFVRIGNDVQKFVKR